jgi:hypothetical protein
MGFGDSASWRYRIFLEKKIREERMAVGASPVRVGGFFSPSKISSTLAYLEERVYKRIFSLSEK